MSEEEIELLNEIAEKENIDRSGLIRKFLIQQMKRYHLKKFAEFYRKGVISLQEAATAAKVSIYEMMEYVETEKIRPPVQSEEEILAEIEESSSIMKKSRKE